MRFGNARFALLSRWSVSAVISMAPPAAVAAQVAPRQPVGVFTAAQADSGRAIYERTCAGCHGVNFEGSGDAPPLAGGTFLLKWGPKMISELLGEILQTMPPANP